LQFSLFFLITSLLSGCGPGDPAVDETKIETEVVNVVNDFEKAIEDEDEDLLKSIIVDNPIEQHDDNDPKQF
jgi:hypothetical protein